jgi:hypothetical protein
MILLSFLKRYISILIFPKVEIIGMASESECEHEMFVEIHWDKRTLAVPLAQVVPITGVDANTKEALEDWHYWVNRGYEL